MFNTETKSRCAGCKSSARMALGCGFITCAVKKKGIEFCWECSEKVSCDKWRKHRIEGKQRDSFKCYQTLESDIKFIGEHGTEKFEEEQKTRQLILQDMLEHFNDGRSKSYFCIASTVLKIDELKVALVKARAQSADLELKQKAAVMHSILDSIAKQQGYFLKLRK